MEEQLSGNLSGLEIGTCGAVQRVNQRRREPRLPRSFFRKPTKQLPRVSVVSDVFCAEERKRREPMLLHCFCQTSSTRIGAPAFPSRLSHWNAAPDLYTVLYSVLVCGGAFFFCGVRPSTSEIIVLTAFAVKSVSLGTAVRCRASCADADGGKTAGTRFHAEKQKKLTVFETGIDHVRCELTGAGFPWRQKRETGWRDRPIMSADDTLKFCSLESSLKSPAVAREKHDAVRCP